jgi:hypothetical protein
MSDELQIVSVMSVPMCGWNPHWGCHSAALAPFRLADQVIMFGAWWDHGMSNALEEMKDRGNVDWVLAIDYDSMFTAQHVSDLLQRFGENPEIDALAALQPRRGTEETPIMTVGQDTQVEFGDAAVRCDSAHFGLTLLRMDAIAKMPLPWFLHTPDPQGSYRSKSRLDPDIYFWKKWGETGNTLYVDPNVRIGHLQPMVAELHDDGDGHLRTRHTHFMEWRKRTNSVKTETE